MIELASVAVLGLVTFAAIVLFYHHYIVLWVRDLATRQITLGGLFGFGTILLMLHSKELSNGLLIDDRVLLMGFAALLAGWRGAITAMLLAISARLLIGGEGVAIGCLTLTIAPLIGLSWRYLVDIIAIRPALHYIGFGFALSLSLATLSLFPDHHVQSVLEAVPALILINVTGAVLAGYMELGTEETAEHRKKIQKLALTDHLTGLDNRFSINQYLSEYLANHKADTDSLGLISIDIDNFRNINGTYGHSVGDRLLVSIANSLQQVLEPKEKLARVEADEFVLLIHSPSKTKIMGRAKQILDVLRRPHEVGPHVIMTTASAGVAWTIKKNIDSHLLLQNSEIAMFQSKKTGRNCCSLFEEGMRIDLERKSRVTHALQQALADGEGLRIVFQPQASLKDGKLTGAEVLLRWHHPELGDVTPAEFIPLAESSGLIRMLDRLVFEMAARQMAEWMEGGFVIHLSINISVLSLLVSGTADELISIFERYNIPTSLVTVEVTESQDLENSAKAMSNIKRLRSGGFSMELDDFGTGHSSLNYLQRLPLTGLKIDRSFVREIENDEGQSKSILRSTIALAKAVNLSIVAEGVETKNQLLWLKEHGCDIAQGYLLDKPLDKEQFLSKHQSGDALKSLF